MPSRGLPLGSSIPFSRLNFRVSSLVMILSVLKRARRTKWVTQGIVKKVFDFFSNYVPSVLTFSRVSGIDCAKPLFDRKHAFSILFRFWSIYSDMELIRLELTQSLIKCYSSFNIITAPNLAILLVFWKRNMKVFIF